MKKLNPEHNIIKQHEYKMAQKHKKHSPYCTNVVYWTAEG